MIFYISLAFVAVIMIRNVWLTYNVEKYQFKTLHYLQMNPNLPPTVYGEMADLWPKSYLHWDWLHWDFSRYVVHQDHYQAMEEYMESQLDRKDLDIDTVRRELAEAQKLPITDLKTDELP